MGNKRKTDIVHWLFLIAILLLLFELFFNGPGLLFLIAISVGCIYFGRKSMGKTFGKILFWIGVISLIFTVLSTLAFQFLIVVVVIYLFLQWHESKKGPAHFEARFTDKKEAYHEEVINRRPLFKNKWFGQQRTEKKAFEWQDINIQSGVGDTVIDLNYTVLPKEEAVIFIRNIVGNVKILVPYEMEISLNHSVIFGSIQVFDHKETNVWNRVLHLQTSGFDTSQQKVKIFTSMVFGKIEVIRI